MYIPTPIIATNESGHNSLFRNTKLLPYTWNFTEKHLYDALIISNFDTGNFSLHIQYNTHENS